LAWSHSTPDVARLYRNEPPVCSLFPFPPLLFTVLLNLKPRNFFFWELIFPSLHASPQCGDFFFHPRISVLVPRRRRNRSTPLLVGQGIQLNQQLAQDIYLFSSDGSMGPTSSSRNRGPMSPTQPSASKRARATSPARFDPPPSGSAAQGNAPTPVSLAPRVPTCSSTTAATREAGQTLASMGASSSAAGGEGPQPSVNELAELRVLRQMSRGERQSGDADPALTSGANPQGARSGEADPVLTSEADAGVAGSPGGNPRVVPAAPTLRPLLSRIVRGGNRLGERAGAVRVPPSSARSAIPVELASGRRGSVRAAPSAEEDEGGGGEGGTLEDRFEEGLSRIQFRRAGPNTGGGNEVTFRLSVDELMNAVHAVSSARQRRDTDLARAISAEGARESSPPV
jgi:hypothetical protein